MPSIDALKFMLFSLSRSILEIRLHEAKFFFLINAEGVRHGFYIEKNWDEMDYTWDWHRFTASLKQHTSVWHQLTQTMGLHKLRWEAYRSKLKARSQGERSIVDVRADQLSLRDSQNGPIQIVDWSDFARLLDGIEQTQWCDLYLVQQIEKHEAIQLGVRIADRVAEVWNLLVPLYLVTVQRSSP